MDGEDSQPLEDNLELDQDVIAAALAASGIGVWARDLEGGPIRFSSEMFRLLGLEPQAEPVATLDVVHPLDRHRLKLSLDAALGDLGPYDETFRVVHPDGKVREVRERATLGLDEQGRPARFTGTLQDVTTERKEAREIKRQRALWQRILEAAPVGLSFIDRDLVYRWSNHGHGDHWRYAVDDVTGHTVEEAHGLESAEPIKALLREVLSTLEPYEAKAMPFRTVRQGVPRTTYWDFAYLPVFGEEGRVEGVLSLSHEVSDRIEKQTLQQERIAMLEQADRLKDEFLGIVSHELRTPLNMITGYVSLMIDGLAGDLESTQAEFLTHIDRGAERMTTLVNNLLDASMMAAGHFRIDPVPVAIAEVVEEAVEAFRPRAAAAGLELSVSVEAQGLVMLDGPRIIKVLRNLLDNACKFTPPGGRIALQVMEMHDRLIFEVRDTGVGFVQDTFPRLFRPFTQGDQTSTRLHPGTGLGLALCKHIIEWHGGKLHAFGTPGQGSVFRFDVPTAEDEETP